KVALPKFAPARRSISLAPSAEERMAAFAAVAPDSMFDSQAAAVSGATPRGEAAPPAIAPVTPLPAPAPARAPAPPVVLAQASMRPSAPVGRWALKRNPFEPGPDARARSGSAQGELT